MRRFWTTNTQRGLIGERREQLELLFAFANADLSSDDNWRIMSRFIDFLELATRTFMQERLRVRIPNSLKPMLELQEHLRARFNEIIVDSMHYVEMPLWTVSGSLAFTLDRGGSRFHQKLALNENPNKNDLHTVKILIDWALIKIAVDLDLEPRRFHQCPRCRAFFYQPTKKEKVFCSTRCGDAVRLQKFRKRKEGTEKK